MNNNPNLDTLAISLVKAEQKLKGLDFAAAYNIYQDLITKHQNSPELFNNLAICAHQLKKNQECEQYIDKALELEPKNPSYLAQKAKFLDQSEFKTAIVIYEQALKLAENNQEQHVLTQIKTDYANLLYNYGCAYAQEKNHEQIKQAIDLFKHCTYLNPNDYKPIYNLACCYINLDDLEQGVKHLKQTLLINENHSQAHFALSQYYQKSNNSNMAEEHLKKSIASDSINKAQAEYNYGVLKQEKGEYKKSLDHYHKCIELCPEHFAAHYNIASINQTLMNNPVAIEYYQKAIDLKPGDITCQYLLTSLQQEKPAVGIPEQAPNEYIENLFNSYSDKFEYELVDLLKYQTPECLLKVFTESIDIQKLPKLNILDLGCGTGLVAEKFAQFSKHLTGIDLAQGMLEVADKKNIYNNLIKSEIIGFLEQSINENKTNYNLITISDVLVYFGKLDCLFELCAKNLEQQNNHNQHNYILFSIELLNSSDNPTNKPYILNDTGRYSHSEHYINDICQKLKLKIITKKLETLRKQYSDDVKGMIYLLTPS